MAKKGETARITFEHFNKISNTWSRMVKNNPKLSETKMGYAIKRFFEQNLEVVFDEYNLKLSTIRIDNALTDEKTKAVLTANNNRGFEYDREGLKKVLKQEHELDNEWKAKEFDVVPFICKDIPEMDEVEFDTFKGFVL